MSEQESLELITTMIRRVQGSFHESGTSAILWGSVIAVCGLVSYARMEWALNIGFDIWWLVFAAVIPQVIIIARERRKKLVKTHLQTATNGVWTVFAISIAAMMIYQNVVPGVTDDLLVKDAIQLLQTNAKTGQTEPIGYFVPSVSSVYLIIYAFPTMATGLINRFRPMIWGALICYGLFLVSLFTVSKYDMLLVGLAGICNWLIPGLILRNRFLKGDSC